MTAVLVPQTELSKTLTLWHKAATEVGRPPASTVLHWQAIKQPGPRKHLVTSLVEFPGVQTISVVLCKWHLKRAQMLRSPEYLYHWCLRLLVERLSWFGEDRGDRVTPMFAEVKGHPPALVRAYLRRLRRGETYIRWASLQLPPRFGNPGTRRMLQVADVASGAIFAAFEQDLYGFTDQSYVKILKPVIWCRNHRYLWQDGLKVGPWPDEDCKKEHPWVEDFAKK